MGLLYYTFTKIFDSFWKFIEKQDFKRLKETILPEGLKSEDFEYIADSDTYHTYSICWPKDKDITKLPILIDIHGGGWAYGTKETNKPFCMYLASQGLVVMSMSYRLIRRVTTPIQFKDIADSISSFLEIAKDRKLDTDNIFLTGDSAGAYFAIGLDSMLRKKTLSRLTGSSLEVDFKGLILNHPAFDFDLMKKQSFYYPCMFRAMFGKEYKKDDVFLATKNTESLLDGIDDIPPIMFITSKGDKMMGKTNKKVLEKLHEYTSNIEVIDNFEKPDCHVYNVMFIDSEAGKKTNDSIVRFIYKHSKNVQ